MINALRRILRPAEVSWHVTFLSNLSAELRPDSYAELGIYEGETFNKILAKRKYAVDISKKALNFIPDCDEVIKIHGTSAELGLELKRTKLSLDLLFIDANHDSEAVQFDFETLEKFVGPRGVVLFHDTFPGDVSFTSSNLCGDAYLAIPALQQKFSEWHFVTLPIHPGLTIATRRGILPAWVHS